jgi:CTP:molybdopterin cytidylyltransferase MocA
MLAAGRGRRLQASLPKEVLSEVSQIAMLAAGRGRRLGSGRQAAPGGAILLVSRLRLPQLHPGSKAIAVKQRVKQTRGGGEHLQVGEIKRRDPPVDVGKRAVSRDWSEIDFSDLQIKARPRRR